MKIGTKTILYGGHQFFIHPLFVFLAWNKLYGLPNLEQLVAIFVHDCGYWGKSNIEGPEGKLHPELGSKVMKRVFGRDLYVAGHSRSYAAMKEIKLSMLCAADKYSWCFYPVPLMVFCAIITGEIDEYLEEANTHCESKEALECMKPPYKKTLKDVARFYRDIKRLGNKVRKDL